MVAGVFRKFVIKILIMNDIKIAEKFTGKNG